MKNDVGKRNKKKIPHDTCLLLLLFLLSMQGGLDHKLLFYESNTIVKTDHRSIQLN